jgi:hypothetical protein
MRLLGPLMAIVIGCPSCTPAMPSFGVQGTALPTATDAAHLALDDYFSGFWEEKVIYIESAPFIPPDLKKVGKYRSEVVSEGELRRRFAGLRIAPSFARVRARALGEGRYIVTISFAGL